MPSCSVPEVPIMLRHRFVLQSETRSCIGVGTTSERVSGRCVGWAQGLSLGTKVVQTCGSVIAMPLSRQLETTFDSRRWKNTFRGMISTIPHRETDAQTDPLYESPSTSSDAPMTPIPVADESMPNAIHDLYDSLRETDEHTYFDLSPPGVSRDSQYGGPSTSSDVPMTPIPCQMSLCRTSSQMSQTHLRSQGCQVLCMHQCAIHECVGVQMFWNILRHRLFHHLLCLRKMCLQPHHHGLHLCQSPVKRRRCNNLSHLTLMCNPSFHRQRPQQMMIPCHFLTLKTQPWVYQEPETPCISTEQDTPVTIPQQVPLPPIQVSPSREETKHVHWWFNCSTPALV